MTFSADGTNEASAKVCDFLYMEAVTPLYTFDSSVAYFVDCGDHNTDTVSGRDKLGMYNSVSEQLYGPDEVTGRMWGLIDDPTDQYKGSGKSRGIYTANTWPDEYHTADGADKTSSWRYTKNQYESNIARHLDYGFSLPDGTYSVELAFADPWGCSKNPAAYANLGEDTESVIVKNAPVDGTAVKGEVTVRGGKLTINVRSEDKAINLCYILIRPIAVEAASVTGCKGDVNLDGSVSALDAVLLQKYLHGQESLTGEQCYAADVMSDATPDILDLAALKHKILKGK